MARMTPTAIARRERATRALRLRATGMTWADVARDCGYPTPHHALIAAQRLNERETLVDVAFSRSIAIERIEALMRALWPAALNPGMAIKAAREAGQPAPPSQVRAIELLIPLLDALSRVEGTRLRRAEVTVDPIKGRADVMHWVPDEAFMVMYARVLREAGLLED